LSNRSRDKLAALAARYRDAYNYSPKDRETFGVPGSPKKLNEPPETLYGMFIRDWIVVFMALNTAKPEEDDRTKYRMMVFDFSRPDQDVWNAMAIAILVIHAIDPLIIMDIPEVMKSVEPETEVEDDPDA